ncbi:MAG: hypothetical protein WC657_07415 [Candidatus Paceibacterota bacterium]
MDSVPYQVSARWVFYRLLQEGYYNHKSDYKNKWVKAVSSARHAFYNSWRPDTLADETREAIIRGRGFMSVEAWLEAVSSRLSCDLDKWNTQEYYLELWYEARAMSDQFRHYTQHITLRPMAGQPSIPYKWQIAKDLEEAARSYGLPIIILYFGDLDTAGETISDVVERDVRTWCSTDFEFTRCGLTLNQVKRYGVPENPEKPGEYQWEALSDTGAKEVIKGNVDKYLHHGAFETVEDTEKQANEWIRRELVGLEAKWQDNSQD